MVREGFTVCFPLRSESRLARAQPRPGGVRPASAVAPRGGLRARQAVANLCLNRIKVRARQAHVLAQLVRDVFALTPAHVELKQETLAGGQRPLPRTHLLLQFLALQNPLNVGLDGRVAAGAEQVVQTL